MQEELEVFLTHFPIYEYCFLDVEQISFTDRVRTICREECDRYGTTWACPPAVGSVASCREKSRQYKKTLFFSTISSCKDVVGFESILKTKAEHEEITQQIYEFCRQNDRDCLMLSSESCNLCEKCTYPDAPCRLPEKMHPCIESYGIVVSALTEQCHMDYCLDEEHMLWFSLLFFS